MTPTPDEPGAADPAHAEPHPGGDDALRERRRRSGTSSTRRSIRRSPTATAAAPGSTSSGPSTSTIALAGRARRQPDGEALHQRLQHHEPGQARLPAWPWCATSRAAACRSTASATRCTTTSSFRRPQSVIDAVNLFDTTGRRAVGHRAGRQHLQRLVPDAVHQLHRHPGQSRHIAGRLQLPRLRPGAQAGAGEDRVDHHLGDLGRQVVADVVDQGRRAAAVRPVAARRSPPTGRSSIRCSSRAPTCRRRMTAAPTTVAGGPGGRLHDHGDEQRRHRTSSRSTRRTTICRPPTCR